MNNSLKDIYAKRILMNENNQNISHIKNKVDEELLLMLFRIYMPDSYKQHPDEYLLKNATSTRILSNIVNACSILFSDKVTNELLKVIDSYKSMMDLLIDVDPHYIANAKKVYRSTKTYCEALFADIIKKFSTGDVGMIDSTSYRARRCLSALSALYARCNEPMPQLMSLLLVLVITPVTDNTAEFRRTMESLISKYFSKHYKHLVNVVKVISAVKATKMRDSDSTDIFMRTCFYDSDVYGIQINERNYAAEYAMLAFVDKGDTTDSDADVCRYRIDLFRAYVRRYGMDKDIRQAFSEQELEAINPAYLHYIGSSVPSNKYAEVISNYNTFVETPAVQSIIERGRREYNRCIAELKQLREYIQTLYKVTLPELPVFEEQITFEIPAQTPADPDDEEHWKI